VIGWIDLVKGEGDWSGVRSNFSVASYSSPILNLTKDLNGFIMNDYRLHMAGTIRRHECREHAHSQIRIDAISSVASCKVNGGS